MTGGADKAGEGPSGAYGALGGVLAMLVTVVVTPLNGTLMNTSLFPLFDAVFPFARDIAIVSGIVLDALLVLAAMVRPRVFSHPVALTWAGMLVWLGGLGAVGWALLRGDAAVLVVGSSLLCMSGALFGVLTAVWCCSRLSAARLLVAVPAASVLCAVLSWAMSFAGQAVSLAVYALSIPLTAAISVAGYAPELRRISEAPGARDLAVTAPASYLPLGSRVFACLFVFSLVGGFLLRFSQVEGAMGTTAANVVVLLAAWAYCSVSKSPRRMDSLVLACVLLIAGGFLLVPVQSVGPLATGTIAVGNTVYNLVANLMVLTLASRNGLAALVVVGWSKVWATLGTTVGANVGAVVKAGAFGDGGFVASALMAVLLLAFVLFGLRDFSFDDTIAGIEPARVPEPLPEKGAADIDLNCARLARECNLTAREAQVLHMLARGRNNSYIQDELTLTRNTVKSYIKHIYTKLDVHSQQELIDRVTGEGKRL